MIIQKRGKTGRLNWRKPLVDSEVTFKYGRTSHINSDGVRLDVIIDLENGMRLEISRAEIENLYAALNA